MFVRNRAALFFTLLVPLLIMLIFGVLNFGGTTEVALGVVDEANNEASAAMVGALDATEAFVVEAGNREDELEQLAAGDRDLVLVIPEGFTIPPSSDPDAQLVAYTNQESQQQGQVGGLLLSAVVGQVMLSAGDPNAPAGSVVQMEQLPGRDLGYSISWCRASWP